MSGKTFVRHTSPLGLLPEARGLRSCVRGIDADLVYPLFSPLINLPRPFFARLMTKCVHLGD